ncbi:related to methylcrotonyl-CoA carboxylase beta chain, mitochondrial precursor [Phialocephala subalpina]|uniref:methylcrotonoyl-CoA carboxylase n=1 Tax=Phialocephala subalpina TaxID=576137 RepID=A0A1L7WPX4_9HELO|nr:related to methylcrotonyl-CoA carboxylase beta chain, mitochondrial precursor [Phialocephala subalpina]
MASNNSHQSSPHLRHDATPSSFPQLPSLLNSKNPDWQTNQSKWKEILAKHAEAQVVAAAESKAPAAISKHTARQLLARDRVALLKDNGTPFLELCSFAGHQLDESSPSASLVAGIGVVSGIICMILAHIPTLQGGAWNEYTVLKQNRITAIATENNLPLIALVQSAGVFLPQQFRVFHKGGQIFRDLALRSKNGMSSCAVVFGSSTAGGAYHPALSDYTIFVKDQAQVFLGGPPLVKMATGEITQAEELGGADMHSSVTGLSDQLAADELDAIRKAREWVLTTSATSQLYETANYARESLEPKYDAEDLLSIVNPDIRLPLDMKEVLLRIVDDSRLKQFKPQFGPGIITAWAHIHGRLTGIIANQNPVILPNESDKAANFIRLCNQGRNPIVFLHNVTGFMVGLKTERAGLIKKGAQLVSAVSTSTVPHISILCGASYGAGNYAMCGRAYAPRFLFAWPTSRCSVMGPDQLGGVMETIARDSAKRVGKQVKEGELRKSVDRFGEEVRRDSESYRTSAHLLDDGVIDPRDTRDVLGMCLEVVSLGMIEGNPGFRGLARI